MSMWDILLKTDEVYNVDRSDPRSSRAVLKWLADPKNRSTIRDDRSKHKGSATVVRKRSRGSYK